MNSEKLNIILKDAKTKRLPGVYGVKGFLYLFKRKKVTHIAEYPGQVYCKWGSTCLKKLRQTDNMIDAGLFLKELL